MQRSYCAQSHLFLIATAVVVVLSLWDSVVYLYHDESLVNKSLNILVLFLLFLPAFGAILQSSLFGLAGILPASYTTPIMSGQGLAGAFAAFSMICALASMSHTHTHKAHKVHLFYD